MSSSHEHIVLLIFKAKRVGNSCIDEHLQVGKRRGTFSLFSHEYIELVLGEVTLTDRLIYVYYRAVDIQALEE